MGSPYSISVLLNSCSGFEILVEDSDTGSPSSITVWMEYLFAFQLLYCERFVGEWWGGVRKHCFVNFSFFGSVLIVG